MADRTLCCPKTGERDGEARDSAAHARREVAEHREHARQDERRVLEPTAVWSVLDEGEQVQPDERYAHLQ